MNVVDARKWLIISSLGITGAQFIFLLIAPVFGYPLAYPKNLDLLQIIFPVFVGYLGAASHFIFNKNRVNVTAKKEYLGLLVMGPIIIYCFAMIAAFFAFGYSNRLCAQIGSGMSIDHLRGAVSISLAVLAATTSVIISYLFSVEE
jgi:hypothetical protein